MLATRPRAFLLWFAVVACGGSASRIDEPDRTTTAGSELAPPIAAARSYEVASPNGNRNDPYYWLRDDTRKSADVLAYLEAENTYSHAVMKPVESLQKTLFAEMRSRIKEDDASV